MLARGTKHRASRAVRVRAQARAHAGTRAPSRAGAAVQGRAWARALCARTRAAAQGRAHVRPRGCALGRSGSGQARTPNGPILSFSIAGYGGSGRDHGVGPGAEMISLRDCGGLDLPRCGIGAATGGSSKLVRTTAHMHGLKRTSYCKACANLSTDISPWDVRGERFSPHRKPQACAQARFPRNFRPQSVTWPLGTAVTLRTP